MLPTLLLLACAPPEPPPDILLVTLDTTRADALACYGNTEAETPTLDRLAAEGVRFSRAYTVTPLTIPAHASIHTGLYPPRHGVRDNGDFVLRDEAVTLAERAQEAGYATVAATGAEVTARHWGFGQGFGDYYDELSAEGARSRWQVERPADQVVDDALGWLASRDDSKPWLMWMHLFDAHSPYAPPEPYATRFAERPYLGALAFADAQLGRLLEAVDLSRTWVIVLADHGEAMGAHGELMHGVLLYNATTRVPFIVRPPGGGTARHVHFPVSLVDVMPTILALAGAPPAEDIDGMDLSPWLRPGAEPPEPIDRSVYVESLYAWRHYGWSSQRALVGTQWKLIDSTTPELYARSDYAELDNRAPEEADAVEAMRQAARLHSMAEGLDGAAALSAQQRAQLEALGYMASIEGDGEGDGFELGLPDPVGRLSVLSEVEAARLALQGGELDEALRRIDAVLAVEPGLAAPRQLRAHVLWRQQQRSAALDELQQLRSSRPSAAVSVTMGLIRLELGEVSVGLRLLEEALEREPHLEGAWQPYLQALYLSGQRDALDAALAEAQRQGAAAGTVAILSAVVSLRPGDVASEAGLEAAIAAHPEVPLGRSALAAARAAAGDPVAAEQLLLDEIALAPGAPMPRRMLVGLLAEQRRYAEQLAELEVLESLEPVSTALLHAQAQALFNLGRHGDSLGVSRRCLGLDAGAARCKLLEANALMKLGRVDEAHAAHREARGMAGLP